MKLINILHTIFIVIVSILLTVSIFVGPMKQFFNSSSIYMIHIIVSTILILIGFSLVYVYLKWKKYVTLFQIIWWGPQLFILMFEKIISDEVYSIYYHPFFIIIPPLRFNLELNSDLNLLFGIHTFVLLMICITIIIRFAEKKKEGKNINVQ